MRFCSLILIAELLFPALALADGPTTQPADVAALIHQLGDDSYKIRAEAAQHLREIGAAAIPALRDAKNSRDPEVRVRVQELIEELSGNIIPGDVPLPPVAGNGGFYPYSVRKRQSATSRIVDASEEGRSIHIEQYPTGTLMTISGQIHGDPVTREYRFRTEDALRAANAEAFKLYAKYMPPGDKLGQNVTVQIQVHIQGAPLPPQTLPANR
ncbi:MAG TPA: HEAT repeat domain-containing protein [Humisphaera sp.]|jgi:hypothetical protein|nr:HEAT repeat domain-containing protein [Humisphaera sp.]